MDVFYPILKKEFLYWSIRVEDCLSHGAFTYLSHN